MTDFSNRMPHVRVGVVAVAVFVALLLLGAARSQGQAGQRAVPALTAPSPDPYSGGAPRDRGVPRDGFDGPHRGGRGFGPGGGAPGGTAPAPAPAPNTDGGGEI